MVRTVKEIFKKSPDWPLALLAYRNAPGLTGYSPAQLLMGRSLRTRLPVPMAALLPEPPNVADFHWRNTAQQRHQRQDFYRRHAAQDLWPLEEGERVWIHDAGPVLSPAQRPRSYVVQTDAGALIRNRRHLVPQQSPSSGSLDFGNSSPWTQGSESLPQTPTPPEPVSSSPTRRALTPLPVASPLVAPATPSRPPGSVVRTHSGRCVRPPVWLNL
ncbi:uncharacterized protein LOC119377970 [Rhipicephalus sanguineus]|uniref:uncharacterized protein LOC119377970 n=1 Tax=Rhipicephalus sanguineus TaxID=34632 RepID=UPI0020C20B1A|nr:uncharacterized protein LOC119377970 [Rhipicephalus sanguineus]